MIELIATAGSLIVGGGIGYTLNAIRNGGRIMKLRRDFAELDKKYDRLVGSSLRHVGDICSLIGQRDKAYMALDAEKAKRSAAIAAGNRTRRINRLAREAENARLEKKAEQAFARKTVKVIGSGVGA